MIAYGGALILQPLQQGGQLGYIAGLAPVVHALGPHFGLGRDAHLGQLLNREWPALLVIDK